MKNSLLVCCAVLLFFSCSKKNDDVVQEQEQEVPELKIKKFTITEIDSDNRRNEYYFDEEAKPIQWISTIDGIDRLEIDVFYDDLGLISGIDAISVYQGVTESWFSNEYEYNVSQELEEINRFDEHGNEHGKLMAIHYQDSIQVNRVVGLDGETNTTFIYGADNRLVKSVTSSYLPSDRIKKYTYSNGNLVNIENTYGTGSYNETFEHDDKINPLHAVLMRDYKNFSIDDLGLYLVFNRIYSYSENNTVLYHENNGPDVITTFQYNDLDYPISAQKMMDGEIYETFTYEYY